jgi:hypothetical protein
VPHPPQECHQSYQTEFEKTDPACETLMTLVLSEEAMESVAAMTDYACAAPTAPV